MKRLLAWTLAVSSVLSFTVAPIQAEVRLLDYEDLEQVAMTF